MAFGTLGLCALCLAGPVLLAASWPAAVVAIVDRKVKRPQGQKLVAVFQAHLIRKCWNAKMVKAMTKVLDPCSFCRRKHFALFASTTSLTPCPSAAATTSAKTV